jgi:glycosyltransferase involved in cell wall biosynthesis
MAKLVITIPCYNDAKFLEDAVNTVRETNHKLLGDRCINEYVLVIAEDGSTDGSAEIAKRLSTQNSDILHIHADKKLGRGRALMNAWKKVNGEVYAFVDCDLATDMEFYPRLIRSICDGYDLATGSRYMRGSVCQRPLLRKFSSIAYNGIIRFLFHDNVHDHQCGFKALSGRMVEFMLRECQSADWFLDTELIVLARRNGFRIIEFPVKWQEKKGKRTPLNRLIRDVWIHGKGIVRLFARTLT